MIELHLQMYKTLTILVLLGTTLGQQDTSVRDGDLDTIFEQIFATPDQNGQNAGGNGQNTGGSGQNTGGSGQNTGGSGKNTGGIPDRGTGVNTGGPSTIIVPPPGISDATNDTSCTTENNEVGQCVRYYLCNSNNSVNGKGIIDIRVRDSPCPSYLDTCCLLPNTDTDQDLKVDPEATNGTSCTTENNEVGECVRYYLCNSNKSVNTDGPGIIDIRAGDSPCPSYLDTCCLLPDTRPPTDRRGGGTSPGVTTIARTGTGNCVLPPYPAHGRYTVGGAPKASPGQRFSSVQLNVTCNPGYGVEGEGIVYCYDGSWSVQIPQCVRYCRLNKHPSVEYRCLISGNSIDGTRPCDTQEPSGTIVRPECNTPNYHFPGVLNYMRCIEGSWDYVAICFPECGRPTPGGVQLVIGGWSAKRGELPWHAGIYTKTSTPYTQICGGSLVKTTVVISAAHCFWDGLEEKALPAANYAVAVGKLYRPWNNPRDTDAQKSDVSDIKIPQRFRGASANFQEDIAIMILTIAFEYRTYVRPVCVDFEITFESKQLKEGHMGKVAGWGLTDENGNPSQVLKVVDLPFINFPECYAASPSGFREYLTSDKICAGFRNGTALCKGDSGGGLVFPESDRGVERYYLRGVVSTAPNNDNLCNANAVTSFTQISKHERFYQGVVLTIYENR